MKVLKGSRLQTEWSLELMKTIKKGGERTDDV